MRIALVEMGSVDPFNIYSMFPMPRGIPLLAAILKQLGHEVVCFVESLQSFSWRDLVEFDMVGFGMITCTANPTYRMARKLRSVGYKGPIVTGGPHATACPEESLQAGADYVVRHEGDITLPELVKAIETNTSTRGVLGVTWKNNGFAITNPDRPFLTEGQLSELPLPAFGTIMGVEKMTQVPLNFSRGCQFPCEFCAVREMFGLEYRTSSVEYRIGQLRTMREEYPILWERCGFFFTDDNLYGNRRKIAIEMQERMISESLIPPQRWVCQMRVGDADEEATQLMNQAGSATACVGLESTNPEILKSMKKGQTANQIRDGLANLRRNGIQAHAMIIAGAPKDNFRKFFNAVRQIEKWGVHTLQTLILVPIPGTPMARRLKEEGRILSFNYDDYNGQHVASRPENMSVLGAWLCLYYVCMIWFYQISPTGRRLKKMYPRAYRYMTKVILHQVVKWSWYKFTGLFVR